MITDLMILWSNDILSHAYSPQNNISIIPEST